MGAQYFSTAAWGKTPEAAFREAQERARWQDGHGDKWGPAVAVEVTSPAERKTLAPYWQEGTRKRGDRLFLLRPGTYWRGR